MGTEKAEVLVLSPKENALGISRLDQNKLTFPESLPIEGNVKAFDLFDIDNDGALEILAVTEGTGRVQRRRLRCRLVAATQLEHGPSPAKPTSRSR